MNIKIKKFENPRNFGLGSHKVTTNGVEWLIGDLIQRPKVTNNRVISLLVRNLFYMKK